MVFEKWYKGEIIEIQNNMASEFLVKKLIMTTKMNLSVVAIILLLGVGLAQAADYTITSPDGNHSIGFTVSDGMLYYNVSYKKIVILSDSQLSMTLDGDDLSGNFQIDGTGSDSADSNWTPVVGSKNSYPDAYNERVIHLSETTGDNRLLDLTFRAYNEGVAFRYTIPEQAAFTDFTILSENSAFQFTGDHDVYWDDYPQAEYSKVKLSAMPDNAIRPLLLDTGSLYIAIAEAGSLENYAPMKLNNSGNHCLITRFRSGTVSASDPISTPWRVVMVAEEPGTLVENHYLLQNLSPPNAIGDTSWIKPGKCWRSGLTTAAAKEIIDYAQANNYQYVHYDAGWYGPEGSSSSNPVTTIDAIDIHDVISYGNERGIGLICYINKTAMSGYDLDNTFSTYENWGIKGVKFGFVNWQSQSNMNFLYTAIQKAAQYHLLVDIHDNFRLTGIERTYPNLLTVEGILGNESTASNGNDPENVLTTSFARMIAGAGDFTPCYLNSRVVSRSFQLALGVVFYSPFQYLHWYDQPDAYSGSYPELEFWHKMPTTWDDSKVIQGSIGNYMTVARKSGGDWFVGTITNGARSLDIPLSFLDSRTYTAKIYKENASNKKYVTIETMEVSASDTITVAMSSGSGHAVWITTSDTDPCGGFDAFSVIEAEDYCNQSGIDSEDCVEGGLNVGWVNNGDWCQYDDVDFGSGAGRFQARVASDTASGAIEIRLDSLTGPLVGTCPVSGTGGWQGWISNAIHINEISGIHDVYLVFKGSDTGYLFNVNWFTFSPSGGDLTFDGKVDMDDIAELAKDWQAFYIMVDLLEIASNWLNGTVGSFGTISVTICNAASLPSTDSMQPEDLAGAPGVRVDNWNNWLNGDANLGVGEEVIDNNKAVTGMTANIYPAERWSSRDNNHGNDLELFSDVIDVFGADKTISVANVPYAMYDVYCYMRDDGVDRAGYFTINDTTYYMRGGLGNPAHDGTGYIVSEDTTIGSGTDIDQGNYVVFRGLTESSFRLIVGETYGGNDRDRNKWAGFQIVEK